MTSVLTAPALRRAVAASLEALRARRDEIDAANVYPVPDGDTGTNLVMTMEPVVTAAGEGDTVTDAAAAVARAALLGARGNSGVILAQLLRGIAAQAADEGMSGQALAAGLKHGADLAYEAVLNPVEGTMLTVARAAADAAAGAGDHPAAVLAAAAEAARAALAETPRLLPVLAEAGVVDAGGMGLCAILDAWSDAAAGREAPEYQAPVRRPRPAIQTRTRETGSSAYAYEVQYMLEGPDASGIPALRDALGALGDSVAVVGGDGEWRIHVHTNDIGPAIEAGTSRGRVWSIEVVAFADQIAARDPGVVLGIPPRTAQGVPSLVAVAAGEGLRSLFSDLGAAVVVNGTAPSVGDVLQAIETAGPGPVIVLPNAKDALAAARQAASESDATVEVIDATDPAAGIAAALAFADQASLGDNAAAMREALAQARTARVAEAVRAGKTDAGDVEPGEAVVYEGEHAVAAGGDPDEACLLAAERLAAAGGEVLTVVTGEGAPDAGSITAALRKRLPGIEIEVLPGGQPVWRYLLLVE